MGQLEEAEAQYKQGLQVDPNSAALKAEAQLVGAVRSNLALGKRCLEEGDARSVTTPRCAQHELSAVPCALLPTKQHAVHVLSSSCASALHDICLVTNPSLDTWV